MPRLALLAALLAGISLAGGGAMWMRAALSHAYAQGERAAQAQAEAAARAEIERRRGLSDAALEQSNREAAAIEAERDQLQEKLDDLIKLAGQSAAARDACLDAELVRALAATGRGASRDRARP